MSKPLGLKGLNNQWVINCFLVPKLHLGTRLLRQFYCRSRHNNNRSSQREIEFRVEQETFPNEFGNEEKTRKTASTCLRRPHLLFHFRPELPEMPDVPSEDFFRSRFQGTAGDERIIDGAADHPHRGILGDGREILLGRQGNRCEARLDIRDKKHGLVRVPALGERHPGQGRIEFRERMSGAGIVLAAEAED